MIESLDLKSYKPIVDILIPSIEMVPLLNSKSLNTELTRELFPEPVLLLKIKIK